ncbi:acyltransferase family protein [Salinicola rhizosphaerae]|uniref:Acyltransferase 3 domain-containing protein n=1 Tax=Salinicola rhizosphaerae TaxID=1443141 RepID=A0ABQ3DU60_9GAMM|nr:acyltransferase [Salinicola rhizosphaerae]GHB09838.1 hypothetical protein GCM10009038_04350 [Salinicola rhizosphaerae]
MGGGAKARYGWIDLMRGTAVILVIMMHSQFAISIRYEGLWMWISILSEYLAPFRMPVLMFLSGLMLVRSMNKGGRRFFVGKLKNIVHPYIVWTFVALLLYYARFVLLGEPMPEELFPLLIHPYNYLWFLYCLIIYYVVAYFLFRLRGAWPPIIAAACYLLYYAVTSRYAPQLLLIPHEDKLVGFAPALPAKIVAYALFFMLGGWLGENLDRFVSRLAGVHPLIVWALAGLCLLGFMLPFTPLSPVYILISLLSLIPLMRLAMVGWLQRCTGALQWCGRQSIVLYVGHIPVLLVAINVVYRALPEADANLAFLILFCIALSSCCVLAWLSQRLSIVRFLFAWNVDRGATGAQRVAG